MVPAIAHKGVHRWRCCVKGHAAHSSQTPRAVNAIEAAARVVARIADMADDLRADGPRHPGFDVPYTTAAVCVMQGGIADNVVPEDCRFHYEFRDLPGSDVVAMQRLVTGYAAHWSRRCRRWTRPPASASSDLFDAGSFQATRRPGGAAGAAPGRAWTDDAGRLRHRGRPVPARRHLHGGLRAGLDRPGAPGRRVRQPGAAGGLRGASCSWPTWRPAWNT
jgi:acetylornithine deacetylase/succinyl-diaminopimelate desuccinylase-like protein